MSYLVLTESASSERHAMPPTAFPRRLLGLLVLLGCSPQSKEEHHPAPPQPFTTHVPDRWAGSYLLDTLSTAERGEARPGALAYRYQPLDQKFRSQILLVVVSFDSSAWVALRAEEGPPPGDSVGSHDGIVYVVGLPQSNPFPGGTADSARFDSLALSRSEAAGFVTFP